MTDENTSDTPSEEYVNMGFFMQLKAYGIGNILRSKDLIFAIILSLAIFGFAWIFNRITPELLSDYLVLTIQMAVALVAISMAGIILIISVPGNDEFTAYLKRCGSLYPILFLYRWAAAVAVFHIVITVLAYLLIVPLIDAQDSLTIAVITAVVSFTSLYCLFCFLGLYGTSARYGHYKCLYYESKNESQSEHNRNTEDESPTE